jgi:branched-chain amino acid transport system substrate-binding protein
MGKDDNLFRINRTTRDNAQDYARVLISRGQKRVAVAFDTRNRNFSESWLKEFRAAVTQSGHTLAVEVPYESAAEADFAGVVRRMLIGRPDGLLFISGALDVAHLAQQARKQAPRLPIAASEWAATEQLIELGGAVVEGLLIVQNFDRDDGSARFREFHEAYFRRFQRKPGYSSVSAHDAATVLLTALSRRSSWQSIKAAVLANGPYQGLQQTIAFDANGDTPRKVFFTEIRDGRWPSAGGSSRSGRRWPSSASGSSGARVCTAWPAPLASAGMSIGASPPVAARCGSSNRSCGRVIGA